jgi:hypothetical protein
LAGRERTVAKGGFPVSWSGMNRNIVCVAGAAVAGIAAVYLLPPDWLAPLAEAAAIGAFVLAVIVRVSTSTTASENVVEGALLQLLNLPEQPFAKVKNNWALTSFLASSAFLVSLGLAVMVRASN